MADSSGIIIHVPVLLEASGNLTIFGETLAAEKVNFSIHIIFLLLVAVAVPVI